MRNTKIFSYGKLDVSVRQQHGNECIFTYTQDTRRFSTISPSYMNALELCIYVYWFIMYLAYTIHGVLCCVSHMPYMLVLLYIYMVLMFINP